MGTQNNPGDYDCWNNAEPDEPRFALLGRDPEAGPLIRRWATTRESDIAAGIRPSSDMTMVVDARKVAADMDRFAEGWRQRKKASTPRIHPDAYHGRVYKRDDQATSKCGGPEICAQCKAEYREKYGVDWKPSPVPSVV